MTPRRQRRDEQGSEYLYHLLRAASERFQTDLARLDAQQMAQVEHQAQKTFELESLVLSSPEARDTRIPEQQLDAAVSEIRRRYPDEDAFRGDLAVTGLDADGLRRALRRELIFDAAMRRVGARAAAVTAVDERLFYELHLDRFAGTERRAARHILITINEEYEENRREAALRRIGGIAAELQDQARRFGRLARQHSECPTAMEEGRLGTVTPGQLYPTLDAALFSLAEGQISDILESEVGFHLVLCERIDAPVSVSFDQASPKIRSVLEARRRRDHQKRWLTELRRRTGQAAQSPIA